MKVEARLEEKDDHSNWETRGEAGKEESVNKQKIIRIYVLVWGMELVFWDDSSPSHLEKREKRK